jgi:hypothetical protein
LEVENNTTLPNNTQTTRSSKPKSNAAQTSDTNTPKDSATVEATPIDLGKLHESENFSSYDLEQLKRLAQIREILGKGGKNEKEDKQADGLALDLLNTIKTSLSPDEKNALVKNQHLETLQETLNTSIESNKNKYADVIKGVGQMMNLFELESRGAFTPVKNTKGGFLSTLIDTIGSYLLGDVAGPNIVKLVKALGAKITPKNLGENTEMGAKTAFGVAGFFGAEEAIGKFLDPMWEKLDHFLNHSLESKTPDMLNKINASAHGFITSAMHGVLGLFGKKIDQKEDSSIENKYSESLTNRIIDYIRNQKEIETQDKWAFSKLVKEMLLEDYQNHYGKPMPKLLRLILDAAFNCVSTTAHTRKMLIANEGAEALKDPLERFLQLPGKIIFHFFNDIVPNVYIFGGRPTAMYAINQKEQGLVDLANKLGIRIYKPSTAANNIVNLDREKAKTPATASAH